MIPRLEDILDVEHFLARDEAPGTDRDALAQRDREIYRQIESDSEAGTPSEGQLIFGWLEYRKYLALDQEGAAAMERLPGRRFGLALKRLAPLLLLVGLTLGMLLAFSFLSYHGTTPVNVALFYAVFILIPLGFTLAGGVTLIRPSAHHRLPWTVRRLLFWILGRMGESGKGDDPLIRGLAQGQGVLFWPVFTLSSLLGTGLAAGILGGTLFKILISDLAFGWQSTWLTSPAQVHDLVVLLAGPWAWTGAPWAHPGLAEIAGSRILLKEGLAHLSTQDLVSWWPFLCWSIGIYTLVPRMLLLAGGVWAGRRARAAHDLGQPMYRKLLARMQSPAVDIRFQPDPVTPAQPVAPQTPVSEGMSSAPSEVATPVVESPPPSAEAVDGPAALVLAPTGVWDNTPHELLQALIRDQFRLAPVQVETVALDAPADAAALAPLLTQSPGPVILLQEVWQPPIRGLLYYMIELRKYLDRPVWILLCQGPESAQMTVPPADVNAQVWEDKVRALDDPGLRAVVLEA